MPNQVTLTLETVEGEGLRFGVLAGRDPHNRKTSVIDTGPGRVAPSPVEMLLVALAGCTAMDVIALLRKKRQHVTAYDVHVTGDRREEHPRRFTRIDVLHRLAGESLSPQAVEHSLELSHSKYCSVSASIDPAIDVRHRYEIITSRTPRD